MLIIGERGRERERERERTVQKCQDGTIIYHEPFVANVRIFYH
jgi:hypothetical protein